MKFWLKASAVTLLALGFWGQTLSGQVVSTGDKMEARLYTIGERMKCQCTAGGCSYTVGSCNMLHCHFREEVHQQMRADISAGASDDAILEKLKNKYGALILASPPAQGFNLLGWLMPFIALVVGLIVIRYVLARWRRPVPAAATGVPPIEKYRDQMEKELADLE
jgi:cytochrome c-type biogenesis protein CcmH/NrfF